MTASMISFLHVLLYTFKHYLNRTNKIISELSRNSYYVYIVHLIVLGLLALMMINVTFNPVVKFFVLSIVTYTVSNIMVSGYRRLFQHPFTIKSILTSLLVAGMCIIAFNTPINKDKDEPNIVTEKNNVVATMSLHEAALFGNVEQLKINIANGVNLNQKDDYGSTPLIIACTFGKTEIAKELIRAGADIHITNNEGSTPLHVAAFFGRVSIVEDLLVKWS